MDSLINILLEEPQIKKEIIRLKLEPLTTKLKLEIQKLQQKLDK